MRRPLPEDLSVLPNLDFEKSVDTLDWKQIWDDNEGDYKQVAETPFGRYAIISGHIFWEVISSGNTITVDCLGWANDDADLKKRAFIDYAWRLSDCFKNETH